MAGLPWPGAVGVSGGGDSLALMAMLARWARENKKPSPIVLTVDHGLRRNSADDAKHVLSAAKKFGLEMHVLKWTGAKPKSDIEAAARAARYRLMGEWCRVHAISSLYLAHTLEDQAETFLLRLARGSGLDGLSAMQAIAPYPLPGFGELKLVRPLLGVRRADLRAFLKKQNLIWIEDPMNDDPRFARVRIRASWPALETLGLSAQRVADAAAHLARARIALEEATAALIASSCRFEADMAFLDAGALALAPREIGLRALAAILSLVGQRPYRPRFERLERLFDTLDEGAPATLHGCRIAPAPRRSAHFGGKTLQIAREKGRKGANAAKKPRE